MLLRRFRDGRAGIDGYAEDYACVVWGLLELFQAGGDPAWLDWAKQLHATQSRLFRDAADGGWFSTSGDDASVLLRLKEDYDRGRAVGGVGHGVEPPGPDAPVGTRGGCRVSGAARGDPARGAGVAAVRQGWCP